MSAVGELGSQSSYGILYVVGLKSLIFFGGGTTDRKWLTNNRYKKTEWCWEAVFQWPSFDPDRADSLKERMNLSSLGSLLGGENRRVKG